MATSDLKPLQLYCTHSGVGPNPWKVALILEELGIPYKSIYISTNEMKTEPYISVNPNGRVPGLVDPNKDITLWESGAIIDYLIDEYDPSHKLQYTSSPEKHTTRCWEHFQMSGQGPYFGQLAWFTNYHPEKIPSAIERYAKEVGRITGVIDAHFAKTGLPYLVGDKLTYADLMFLPFYFGSRVAFADMVDFSQWPHWAAWMERLLARPAIARIIGEFDQLLKKLMEAKAET